MPQQLLEITVRPDWRELTRQAAVQRLRTWRAVQIGLAGATLVVLLSRLLLPDWPWHQLLRLTLFGSLFWLLPLWALLRSQQGVQAALDRLLQLYPWILAAIAVAALSQPSSAASATTSAALSWLPVLALAIPALTWPVLRTLRRAFPAQCRRLGLVRDRWAINLAIGALAGAALGLHLMLTSSFLPGRPELAGPAGLRVVWMLGYQVGLMGLGQELVLRGLAYDALMSGAGNGFPAAAARIVILNLFVYLAALAVAPAVQFWSAAWLLAYGAALAFVATFLRRRQQSLLPGLAASVVFNLFIAILYGL